MKNIILRFQVPLIILLLSSVWFFWVFQGRQFPDYSIIEQRSLSQFPKWGLEDVWKAAAMIKNGRWENLQNIFWKPIGSFELQNGLLHAVSDQFPIRLTFIRTAKAIDRFMIKTTYLFLRDPAIPMDVNHSYYITRDKNTVISRLPYFDEKMINNLDYRLENLKQIKEMFPEKNIYVFYFQEIPSSPFDPRTPYFKNLDGGQAIRYFESHLPSGVILHKMEFSSLQELKSNFFYTDHHMNIRGAWNAYQQLYEMIEKNYPGISPQLTNIQFNKFPDLKCSGTYVRDTLYPIEPEIFEIAQVNLPNFKIIENDNEIKYNLSSEYNAGIYNKDNYTSRYQEYFGYPSGFLTYIYENQAPKNLLLFGSSYKIVIQPWIAAHYQVSYFIDTWRYSWTGSSFSIAKFAEDHDFDDIIIFTDLFELVSNDYIINP